MNVKEAYEITVERVSEFRPSMDCGMTPDCTGLMVPRHSTIVESDIEPYVEDIQLKCTNCRTTQKHGIGITHAEYIRDLEIRGGKKTLNYVIDWHGDVEERLRLLGYKEA